MGPSRVGLLKVVLSALVLTPSAGRATEDCVEQQLHLSEEYGDRRADIGRDLVEQMSELTAWWRSEITPALEEMANSVSADLKAAQTEAERAPIRRGYHAKRRAFLQESREEYHGRRHIAQQIARKRLGELHWWWINAIQTLRSSNSCEEASAAALSEDLDAERRLQAFGEDAPMDQAVAEFRDRMEARRELEERIAAVNAQLKGRIHTLATYDSALASDVEVMADVFGESGLDAVAPALGEKILDRLEAMVFPDQPSELNAGEVTMEQLEQQIDPAGELSREQLVDRITDKLSSDLLTASTTLLHGSFEDAITVMIEKSTIEEKIDLLNRFQRLHRHRDELEQLIEQDRIELEELSKVLQSMEGGIGVIAR